MVPFLMIFLGDFLMTIYTLYFRGRRFRPMDYLLASFPGTGEPMFPPRLSQSPTYPAQRTLPFARPVATLRGNLPELLDGIYPRIHALCLDEPLSFPRLVHLPGAIPHLQFPEREAYILLGQGDSLHARKYPAQSDPLPARLGIQIFPLPFLRPFPKRDRRFAHQLFPSPEDSKGVSIPGTDRFQIE